MSKPGRGRPTILSVVGARPNFMKAAPVTRALEKAKRYNLRLCHTGQHYDDNMSKIFFDDLRLPRPDIHLGVGSGAHGEQTGRVMIAFEEVLLAERPDLVIVVGDVNSTMACTLVSVKMGVPVAHVEAGLRSFDRTMPEEINRMVTDILCALLFTTSPEAETNLLREGVDADKIHFVGNVMIDSLRFYAEAAERSTILDQMGLAPGGYGLVTLHRPSNVDDPAVLARIVDALSAIGADRRLIFPVHPRTRKVLAEAGLQVSPDRLRLVDPIGYLDFMKLMRYSSLVLTDSGGIQEETTALGIPCLTIRENTERPVTVEVGTNVLVGMDRDRIVAEAGRILGQGKTTGRVPDLWDGRAAERIAAVIAAFFGG
ncbi:MAG: UDP-N-acetylglucosamine 2-epimerase (non-hydrolyzing) [Candidatus Krumholzibacteria bacterium]|nr:UDP-N-acetylglucosamine 2-epimerase (non-hydrolyzing) [Candidatus Krumholzibacteria bacterium]